MNKKFRYYLSESGHKFVVTGIVTFISIVVFSACSTTGVISQSTESSILDGAKMVIVNSSLTADSLYHQTFEILSSDGYVITHSSDKMHQVSAKGLQGSVVVNIIINPESDGSQAKITGAYFYEDYSTRAEWGGILADSRKYAFAHLVKIAKLMPGNIMYSKK